MTTLALFWRSPPTVVWGGDPGHPDEQLLSGGSAFMDGSCGKHVVKELRRAGWGLAAYDSQQAPRAAEFGAPAYACLCLAGPVVGFP
eukprot:9418392-Pyramimonas_sp.AAC.1